jgi:hypothetical protein
MSAVFPPNSYHLLNFDDIKISEKFVKLQSDPTKGKKFIARVGYAGTNIEDDLLWGIASPNLTAIQSSLQEQENGTVDIDIVLPTTDPSFINIVTEIENKAIEFVYLNSKTIYGANKTKLVINSCHKSSLRVHQKLGIPVLKLNLNLSDRGTSFWAKNSNDQSPERIKISYTDLLKYFDKPNTIVFLLRLNGVVIEGKNTFYCDWRVDQVLFKSMLNNDNECLLTEIEPEIEPEIDVDIEDIDLHEIDPDNVIEYPDPLDRIVEKNFRKRLFLKF